MIFVIIAIIVVIVLFFTLSIFIASTAVHGRRQTMDESWVWQQDHAPGSRAFQKTDLTDYTVTGPDGYVYHVSCLPARVDSDHYVILAHGYTDTRYGMMKYAPLYHELGFHCVMFDERGHGENAPVPCSYGIREVEGLLTVLDDTKKRFGPDIRIGFHGESLGGATVLTALKYHPEIHFVVDDCGFAAIVPILKGALRNFGIPGFMVYPATLMSCILYKVNFLKARPIDAVVGNQIPLLLMHGAEDDFILPENSARIKEATAGYATLHYFPGAGHALSAIIDPDRYLVLLREFFTEIHFL